VPKKRKSKRKRREMSWDEALELALKLSKPVLDKLREYDLEHNA